MKIAVTAATSQLGQLVIGNLLHRGVSASDIVAVARNLEKAAPLADQGVVVRRADYNDPEALAEALAGVDRVLLISGLEANRAEQHRNVIEAARGAGVSFIAYTSILDADSSSLILAADHRATEAAIRDSGLTFAFLRDSWYFENYTNALAGGLQRGVILGGAGEGRVSAAARADYAEAAAVVLTGNGHENKVYELGGGESFTLSEFAAELTKQSGREVVYRDLSTEAYTQALVEVGLPEGYAALLADGDRGLAAGDLYTESRDLSQLLGHPTTPLTKWIAATLAGLEQRA